VEPIDVDEVFVVVVAVEASVEEEIDEATAVETEVEREEETEREEYEDVGDPPSVLEVLEALILFVRCFSSALETLAFVALSPFAPTGGRSGILESELLLLLLLLTPLHGFPLNADVRGMMWPSVVNTCSAPPW
jgi:hypothetical protein